MLMKLFRAFGTAGLIAIAAPLIAQDELSDDDKEWMEEEVGAIITEQEKEMFQQINEDDRDLFKELFWMRRDYDPRTGDNEYREGYEQRIEIADDNFRARGRKGSETEMGKVFLLLGAPNERESSGAGAQARGPEAQRGGSDTITWIYEPNPSLGIPEGLTIEFRRRDQFGYRIANRDEIEPRLEAARERMIANPAIGYALDENGRLRELDDKFDPNSPAKQVLAELRTTGETSSDIEFSMRPAFFQATEDEIYVPAAFAITEGPTSGDLTFFYSLEDADGFERSQSEEPVSLTQDGEGRWRYEYPFQLLPGLYTLYVGFLDSGADIHGTQIVELEVPELEAKDDLTLSSVVMFSDAEQTTDRNGVPGKAFLLAGYHFKPKADRVYDHSERLSGVLNAYNYGIDGDQPNLTIQVSFFKGDERRGQTEESPFMAQAPQMALTIFDVPLDIPNFEEPGEYRIEIAVTDHVNNETVTEEIEFVIEE